MMNSTPIEPIAVVGLSFRLPGGTRDLDGLWDLLQSGEPAWTPVPVDRYNEEAFYHPSPDDPNGTTNHPGGHFIGGDIRDFDHAFFQFTKAQAAALDPQQRLLMEVTYEALESGGISRESLSGSATSVYAALFPMDYDRQLYRDTLDLPVYYATGVEKAILSNRLSHFFDLRGPSMTLDTACSGGLVALHLACQSLRQGESDTAIVAASNLILGPDHFIGLSNLHMLSSTGRCYPFDQRGEGYGRGEGVVVLVLKRLSAAIQARDPIRAIIRNTAINQDGYTPQSITYPNGQAQAALARKAYAQAGLSPEDIAYVEAHGTGTKAGDREELGAMEEVFAGSSTKRSLPLYVGSIKGAIGHTESAAGLASLLKATVMLNRELIPPVAGFAHPKPGLPLDRMEIPTGVVPWPQVPGVTPRVSINSFGFGGANAHAILEQAPRVKQSASGPSTPSPRLFTLSAHSPASLKAIVTAHRDWIEQRGESVSLADVSYTLVHRRSAMPYRFSTVARDHTSLVEALSQDAALAAMRPLPSQVEVVAVFTGQGAQWAGMGRELLLEAATPSSVFRASLQTSRDILRQLGATWDLCTELLREAAESRLGEAELAQPATTAVQIALVALLRAQGVPLRAVVGHSSGEIAAAYAAGRLSQQTALKVAFHRGFMAGAVKARGLGRGAMLSVGLGEHDAAQYLQGLTSGKAVIACVNSPRSVTVSGDADAVTEVAQRLAAADVGIFHRKLLVDTAYHSHHMRAVADDYRARLGQLDDAGAVANGVVFFSSVTGKVKTSGFDAEYWISNLISPVRFADAVEHLVKARYLQGQHMAFVEIGPHPAMMGPVRQTIQHSELPQLPFDYLASLHRKGEATANVLALAGKLFELGVELAWPAVSELAPGADSAVVQPDLPPYAWDHATKHWHESRVSLAYRQRKEPYHDLLGVPVLAATPLEPRWRHFLSRASLPWLVDHVVDGLTIFPGAGYVCMAIEAVAQLAREGLSSRSLETFVLHDITFKRGLVVPERAHVELQLSLQPQPQGELGFRFTISAPSGSAGEWYEHATGIVEAVLTEPGMPPAIPDEPLPQLPSGSERVSQEDLYHDMDAVGNTYGPAFALLDFLTIAPDASQGLSAFDIFDVRSLMPAQHQRPHVIHPTTLDIVFHTALPLVGRRLGAGSIMPVHIDELLIAATPSLETPGSKLDVATQLISAHFRTGVSDMSVWARQQRVLSISGMEFRSLASHVNDAPGGPAHRQIGYELQWEADIDFLRLQDLPKHPGFVDVVDHIRSKQDRFLTIGLGASVDLSQALLRAIDPNSGKRGRLHKIVSHDFVDATPGRFDDAAERLQGVPVHFRTLRPGTNPVARGFQAAAYDVALVASTRWLYQAAVLVRPGGVVLLVLTGRDARDDTWRGQLSQTKPTPLEELVSFRDGHDRVIAVAKPVVPKLRSKVTILSHAAASATAPAWVAAIESGLRAETWDVSLRSLTQDAVEAIPSEETIIVVDDIVDRPILSDVAGFEATKRLLRKPARVVWVSPDSLAPFHQIEGVLRTAHAENQDIRAITIHAASFCADERVINLIAHAVRQVSDPSTPHTEREYRVYSNGAVVFPRLYHSDRLNRAIAEGRKSGPETELRRFTDHDLCLVLATNSPGLFVAADNEEEDGFLAPFLAADSVEVEVEAFLMSKTDHSASLGQVVGVVTSTGPKVTCLAVGDRVIALAPVVGANRLRIAASRAGHLPSTVSTTLAPALLLDTMAAAYALRNLARVLSSQATVLVHGARTAAGRAAVAVARSLGARVTATATSPADARLVTEEIGIPETDIHVARPSLHRRLARDIFPEGLDAVIQTDDVAAPAEALMRIKPFGSVLVLGSSFASYSKPPPNVAVHFVDIAALLRARPDLTASLVAAATAALEYASLTGFQIPVRDVSEIPEAVKQINTGVHSRVVLQSGPDSSVPVIPAVEADPWTDENATYLIAEGLGDIGQRFLLQIASRGAKHVATLSRRPVEPEIRRALEAKLEGIRPGIRLYTLQGDVTSQASLQAAAADLFHQGAPRVRGVIQAAVVMNDRPLELTTYKDFTSVTNIKVDGTLALHQTFASADLAFFLSLSSISSIVGAAAETSYNAGNAVQDALAHPEPVDSRATPSTRFMTVNLGWSEGAALTEGDEVRQGALRRAGFCLIKLEELLKFIDYVLGAAATTSAGPNSISHAIIGFDTQSLAGVTAPNATTHSALFSQLQAADSDGSAGATGESASGPTFEQVVADGDSGAVTDFIAQSVTDQLSRLISVPASSIDPRQGSILTLGLDSLVAVELRNWIMKQFAAPLQSSEILEDQTVLVLAGKVATRSKVVTAAA